MMIFLKYAYNFRFYILLFILAITNFQSLYSDRCKDYLILDGAEEIVSYGIDTTKHWWAITSPFSGQYRLIVDGIYTDVYKKIDNLTFSPDGNRWACFAQDMTQLYLITNDTIISLPGTHSGELLYSPNSQHLIYSYNYQDIEYIILKERLLQVVNKTGRLYVSHNAERFAFIGYRGDGYVINLNGKESQLFDKIKPIGFWNDGLMLFAGKSGDRWQVYKGEKIISDIYADITDVKINLNGTTAAWTAKYSSGEMTAVIYSDEYYEPLTGKRYSSVLNLALHPSLPMISYQAELGTDKYIVLNSTEYHCGETCSAPFFTFDGSELFFLGCDFDCYANINGKRYPIYSDIDLDRTIAVKPGSRTFAYSSATNLVVRYLERKELVSGIMIDEMVAPRYNWREQRYEALGRINQKLYLMTCTD